MTAKQVKGIRKNSKSAPKTYKLGDLVSVLLQSAPFRAVAIVTAVVGGGLYDLETECGKTVRVSALYINQPR